LITLEGICWKNTRKERFCWGIQNFTGYRSENNFVGRAK